MSANLALEQISLKNAVEFIVDNRGKSAPTESTGIPLIATNCVSNDKLYPTAERLRYVSQETYDNWFRAHPKPGDILLTNKGSQNGAVCLVPNPVNFCIAQDMVALRANSQKIFPLYLFAALRSQVVQKRIKDLNVDAVIPHFKKTDFDKLLIPLPSRPQQEFIGNLHFNLECKIELNRQTNQTLEEMAQALFKSWFVDFEPVKVKIEAKANGQNPERAAMCTISGKTDDELDQLPPAQLVQLRATAALFPDELTDSELGVIPKGWKNLQFGDVIEIFDSKRIPLSNRQREARKGPYPYYGAAALMDYIDDYLFDGTYVLMAEDGTVMDENGYPTIQYVWGKFWVNNHAHVLKGGGGVSDENILLFLKNTVIAPYVTGAVQLKINQKNMKMVTFLKAPEALHQRFGEAIRPLFEGIKNRSNEILVLTGLRDALLPRLLSGTLEMQG